MQLTRRTFLISAAAAAGSTMLLRPARAGMASPRWAPRVAGTYFEWKQVADGVWACMGEGGNVMLVGSGKESILVDAKNAGFGHQLKREAASLAGGLKMLINSHHHADHTAGNNAFVGSVEVLSHAKAAPRFANNLAMYRSGFAASLKGVEKSDKPGAKGIVDDIKADMDAVTKAGGDDAAAKLWTPTKTVSESHTALKVGSEPVELHYVGSGHTDNDLIIHLPGKNVIHTGDLVFNRVWPYVDGKGGFSSSGWIKSLKAVAELANDRTVVIPGHGEVSDKKAVLAQIAFFEDLVPQAEAAVAKGTTREEFTKLTPEKYKDFAPAMDWIRPITLGGLHDEASAKKK